MMDFRIKWILSDFGGRGQHGPFDNKGDADAARLKIIEEWDREHPRWRETSDGAYRPMLVASPLLVARVDGCEFVLSREGYEVPLEAAVPEVQP